MTNDLLIRQALIKELEQELVIDPSTKIVSEVEICMGYSRVDVLLVNGVLHGFEIKSDRDSLDRLTHQAGLYEQVFEKITLICGTRHQTKALEEIAPWWGIWLAHEDSGQIHFEKYRQATNNPLIDPYSLVQLLWREEALSELTRRGLDRGIRSKPRNMIWERLVESLPLNELTETVRECIKGRQDWRIAEQHA